MGKSEQPEVPPEPDSSRLYRAYQLLRVDPTAAITELKNLAELGSTMSAIYLGDAYKFGEGANIDLAEAERWYQRAASAGSLLAYYSLGRLYLKQKRYAEAKNAFTVAAERNYMPAVHFLGRIYFFGNGVPQDIDRARELFERASASGSVFAKRKMATILMRSRFGSPSWARGVSLLVLSFVDLLVVVCTDGLTSDRLR